MMVHFEENVSKVKKSNYYTKKLKHFLGNCNQG